MKLPKIESAAFLDPDEADHVARVLTLLAAAKDDDQRLEALRQWVLAEDWQRQALEQVSTALFALGNDTDAIICETKKEDEM